MIESILCASKDGADKITNTVTQYNKILYDRIIPYIFNALFEIKRETETIEKKVDLLRLPEGKTCWEFLALPELVVFHKQKEFDNKDGKNRVLRDKSFHTDYYCFDSVPERECFWQYVKSDKVKEVYFTGMFTSQYNGLSIQYVDPDTYMVRTYYPDFVTFLDDDTMQIVEVKAENLIDLAVTHAKQDAAKEMVGEHKFAYLDEPSFEKYLDGDETSDIKMEYIIHPSKQVTSTKII
jgi:hypothetical protein